MDKRLEVEAMEVGGVQRSLGSLSKANYRKRRRCSSSWLLLPFLFFYYSNFLFLSLSLSLSHSLTFLVNMATKEK